MYDRYTITLTGDELALVLGVEVSDTYDPNYNAAPTKMLPVITSKNTGEFSFFRWGFIPGWANNKTISPKLFNLPLHSVLNNVSYKRRLQTHRCVIPMDGFYVWKQVAKKQSIPYYFYYPDRRVFSVAGLWEENDETPESSHSFIMITKPAENALQNFQKDMPAIFDVATTGKWLDTIDPLTIEELLNNTCSAELISHTVSPKIRDLNGNDASLTDPAPPIDQYGNFTLFT